MCLFACSGNKGDDYKTVSSPLENAVILAIAAKYGKTPAQVLLRWSIDSGIVPLPKSINPSRIVEVNFRFYFMDDISGRI